MCSPSRCSPAKSQMWLAGLEVLSQPLRPQRGDGCPGPGPCPWRTWERGGGPADRGSRWIRGDTKRTIVHITEDLMSNTRRERQKLGPAGGRTHAISCLGGTPPEGPDLPPGGGSWWGWVPRRMVQPQGEGAARWDGRVVSPPPNRTRAPARMRPPQRVPRGGLHGGGLGAPRGPTPRGRDDTRGGESR